MSPDGALAQGGELGLDPVQPGPVGRQVLQLDARGGATFAGGSGLLGLKDRAEALGGRLWVQTALGAGTTVHAELPLSRAHAVPG